MTGILSKILAIKAEGVVAQKAVASTEEIRRQTQAAAPVRDFTGVIRAKHAQGLPAVIAEIKKASPNKGLIRTDFCSTAIAAAYENAGAACLSVLTDEPYFQGSPEYLKQAKTAAGLPILRKDLIIDEYQVYQTRAQGADAILLIVAAFDIERLECFEQTVYGLNITVLLELHERGEPGKCRNLTTPFWGVSNRNLRTFEINLQQTLDLPPDLVGKTVVIESDIRNRGDVGYMRARGMYTFPIGETFMCIDDIETEVRKLF